MRVDLYNNLKPILVELAIETLFTFQTTALYSA